MVSLAAILAMGNPVALEASAEERDTRGFISITFIPRAGAHRGQHNHTYRIHYEPESRIYR